MNCQTTIRTEPVAREHHWDALRALLMLLGIPYHVAMAYRADQVWILNSPEGAGLFNLVAQAIHVFRMPLFFAIAGYFAALLLARRAPGTWLKGRFAHLGIPFIAALLTLNPLLNFFCELSNFTWRDAIASWEHNSATSGGYVVRHLWFLIVLLYFSALAALACLCVPRLRTALMPARLDRLLARRLPLVILTLAIGIGLWEAIAIEYFYIGGLATNLYQEVLRLDQLIEYTPWFLLGCVLARAPAFRTALYRFSWPVTLFALVTLALDLAYRNQLWAPYGRFLDTLAAVALTQVLVAGMKRFADRPSPLVQEIVRASFVIYLFHLPIVAGLVVVVGPMLAIPLLLKASLFTGLTFALSWGAWLVVRRSAVLRVLYDGWRPQARPVRSPVDLRYGWTSLTAPLGSATSKL